MVIILKKVDMSTHRLTAVARQMEGVGAVTEAVLLIVTLLIAGAMAGITAGLLETWRFRWCRHYSSSLAFWVTKRRS